MKHFHAGQAKTKWTRGCVGCGKQTFHKIKSTDRKRSGRTLVIKTPI